MHRNTSSVRQTSSVKKELRAAMIAEKVTPKNLAARLQKRKLHLWRRFQIHFSIPKSVKKMTIKMKKLSWNEKRYFGSSLVEKFQLATPLQTNIWPVWVTSLITSCPSMIFESGSLGDSIIDEIRKPLEHSIPIYTTKVKYKQNLEISKGSLT